MARKGMSKVDRLDYRYRRMVIGALLQGCTYREVREQLVEAGCPASALPSIKALGSYYTRKGGEFEREKGRWDELMRRASEKSLLAGALGSAGLAGGAQLVAFESLEALLSSVREGDYDPGKAARAASTLLRTLDGEARTRAAIELQQRRQASEAALREAAEAGDAATVMAKLDEILGVKA